MKMAFADLKCSEFAEKLASKDAVPGGGGAAALVGALGAALASMVGNLTLGKKKYAEFQDDIKDILQKAETLRNELLALIDKDAEGFKPLAAAYSIPKDDPSRESVMENALRIACSAPLDMMRACAAVLELLEELVQKGSALAMSDVGCGAVCCKAAVQSAALSVFINTGSMTDREYAGKIEEETENLIDGCCARADVIYARVMEKLR